MAEKYVGTENNVHAERGFNVRDAVPNKIIEKNSILSLGPSRKKEPINHQAVTFKSEPKRFSEQISQSEKSSSNRSNIQFDHKIYQKEILELQEGKFKFEKLNVKKLDMLEIQPEKTSRSLSFKEYFNKKISNKFSNFWKNDGSKNLEPAKKKKDKKSPKNEYKLSCHSNSPSCRYKLHKPVPYNELLHYGYKQEGDASDLISSKSFIKLEKIHPTEKALMEKDDRLKLFKMSRGQAIDDGNKGKVAGPQDDEVALFAEFDETDGEDERKTKFKNIGKFFQIQK
ncbi:hypothetical protein HELRODRAFT_179234 [Helobdella robusta]|uniref:Uncharacterized protein n=1 Tax=Helobdella robusta TaxID=6412 RepID=T1FEE6_HELRO|nr:hypothetical protein HELRODRAFT_179234 [Helobdella robusta]ESN95466.1 hypothetical protein HELRODRAFT_179234 [Helobdella robusta]